MMLTCVGEVPPSQASPVATGAANATVNRLPVLLLPGDRFATRRVKPVLEMAREAGLITFDDTEEAFRTFFGLVVRDVQIRALLGDRPLTRPQQISREAKAAAQQFLTLYGVGE